MLSLKNSSANRNWSALPWVIFFLNLIIKIIYLSNNSIGNDEPFSIFHSQLSPAVIINELSTGNNPPLFELILHYWIGLMGTDAFSVRFLPCIFSSVTAVLILQLVLRYRDAGIAVVVSLVYTFSTYHMQFAHEARTYSLFCMLAVWSYLFFSDHIHTLSGRKLLLWTIANTLLIYTHYLGFLIPATQLLTMFLTGGFRKKNLIASGIMLTGMLVLYMPWINILLARLQHTTSNGTWVKPAVAEDIYNSIWSFSNSPVVAMFFIIVLVSWLILIIKHRVSADRFTKTIALWFIFPLTLMFMFSWSALPINMPIFVDRYLIFFSPAFYILVTCAAAEMISVFKLSRVWLIIPCVAMAVSFNPNPDNKRHVAEAIQTIRQQETSNTLVLFAPADFRFNFAYYYDRKIFASTAQDPVYRKIDSLLSLQHVYGINTKNDMNAHDINSYQKIIYLDAGSSFMWNNNGITDSLNAVRTLNSSQQFRDIFTLYTFE